MMEILGTISMIYLAGIFLTFIIGITIWRDWGNVFGMAIMAILGLFWPITIPMLIKEEFLKRKRK
jgi:succinate-acetate transporter protein